VSVPPFLYPRAITELALPWLKVTTCRVPGPPLAHLYLALRTEAETETEVAATEVALRAWAESGQATALVPLGCSYSAARQGPWITVTASGMSEHFQAMLQAVATAFADGIGNVEQAVADCTRQSVLGLASPQAVSRHTLLGHLYGNPPALLADTAPPRALNAVDPAQVNTVRQRMRGRGPVYLVAVGDVEHGALAESAAAVLGKWRHEEAVRAARLSPGGITPRPIEHHAGSGWGMCCLRLAAPAPSSTHAEFTPFLVCMLLLGGAFSSRLVTRVREDLGLAYRVLARLEHHLDTPVVVIEADTAPDNRDRALAAVQECLAEFARTGPTQVELDAGRRYVQGGEAIALSSQTGNARWIMSSISLGTSEEDHRLFHHRLHTLTRDEIAAVAARWWHPDRFAGITQGGRQAS
jgi:zinc protease